MGDCRKGRKRVMNETYLNEVATVWEAIANMNGINAKTTELMLKVAVGLQRIEEDEAVGQTEPEPKPAPAKPKKKTGGPKLRIDWGKVGALHKAGWDAYKIADEMGASPLTIRQGISSRKWETYVGEDEDENERQED